MTPSVRRPIHVLLAFVLAASLVAVTPSTSTAHDACSVPEPSILGPLGEVLTAVNVFSVFVETDTAPCDESAAFEGFNAVMERDWTGDDGESAAAQCIDGMAADMFPCDGVDLLGHVSLAELGATFVNDMWGWTDERTGREYALVGSSQGTTFVDVSDPTDPAVLGIMPTAVVDSRRFWRDIKVYEDHAFVVSENNGHGMQVFDLTRLRDWDGTFTTYTPDARYLEHGSSHNIFINTDTGYAYSVGSRGSSVCGTGLHIINIQDPINPEFEACFQDHGYIHDTQCVVYDGPDEAFEDREICFNSNGLGYGLDAENYLSIVDVTDKDDIVALAQAPYDLSGYSHQGWLTEDHEFLLHGDEGEEFLGGSPTTVRRVWDVSDLTDPKVIETFRHDTSSIDHNMYVEDDLGFASNYTTGLRVMDVSDLGDDGLAEIGFFDMYPENDNATFEGGTWSNYPYFDDEDLIAVSSIERGLFLLEFDDDDDDDDDEDDDDDDDDDDDEDDD